MMNKLSAILFIYLTAAVAQAVVIDDFEDGDLSDYTHTVILDVGGSPHNTSAWQTADGQLQLNTTVYSDIEQCTFIKSGYTLNVGQELRTDYTYNGGNRAMGLYVGVEPTDSIRQNYISVYATDSTSVNSRGFNGTSEMTFESGGGAYTKLFIARDGENDYEAGFYIDDVRVVIADRDGLVFGTGDTLVVGFYVDVRSTGILGNADNLEIISIPIPPEIVTDPNDVTTSQSQNASFETTFTSSTTPLAAWYKVASPDDLLVDTNQSNIDVQLIYDGISENYTLTLTITDLTTDDSGQYYCNVINDSGIPVNSATANLTVHGLVAHWTLDSDRSGYVNPNYYYLEDVSGYDAEVNGTPIFVPGADGIENHAIQITSDQGSALCPILDPIKQSGQMTISFWANWNETPGTQRDLLAKSTQTEILIDPNGLESDNNWQHICTVYDGSSGKLYIDGVLRDQGPWQLPADTKAVIRIGISDDGQTPFNGAVDDMRLYNYALTAAEVASIYEAWNSCSLAYDLSGPAGQPDCNVNLYDLCVFASSWLNPYEMEALADLADEWLSSGY